MTGPGLQLRMITIYITILMFCKIYTSQTDTPQQPEPITRAHFGEKVTLKCFFSEEHRQKRFYWFKQTLGTKPSIVVQMQMHAETKYSKGFDHGDFKHERGDTHFHLIIEKANRSYEGMYFCGMRMSYEVLFGNGTFLAVDGEQSSGITKVVQAPVANPFYPGDSVTLHCEILTEKQTEEFRVLWFRQSSGDSNPGLIYTHTNRSSECETHCIYTLHKNNLSLSDNGAYYCVVDTCGQVIFGNGTVLEISRSLALFDTVVISLGSILGLCICLVICLIWLNCKTRDCKHCKGRCADQTQSSSNLQNGGAVITEVNYTSLRFSERKSNTGRKRQTQTHDSLYSDVQHHKQQVL